MSAKPEQIYGEDNIVDLNSALNYAQDTRSDKDTRGAVTDGDITTALSALASDRLWSASLRQDYRRDNDQSLADMGRLLRTQIDISRALRLRQAMP